MDSGTMTYTRTEVSTDLIRDEVWRYLCESQSGFVLSKPATDALMRRTWLERIPQIGISLNDFADEIYHRLLSSGAAECTSERVSSSIERDMYNAYYPLHAKSLILEEIFNLLRAGVLIEVQFKPKPSTVYDFEFGFGAGWVVLTDYGKRCIQENRILPHDPQGYLADLQRRCGALDPEVEVLAHESLLTFQANCLVASVILIGAASEQLIWVLFVSYRDAHQAQADRDRLDQEWESGNRRSITQKFRWLWQKLEARRAELNNAGRLWDGTQGLIQATFDALRTARNEAVHQNRQFERIEANEFLFLFTPYTERIYSLINYFGSVPQLP